MKVIAISDIFRLAIQPTDLDCGHTLLMEISKDRGLLVWSGQHIVCPICLEERKVLRVQGRPSHICLARRWEEFYE